MKFWWIYALLIYKKWINLEGQKRSERIHHRGTQSIEKFFMEHLYSCVSVMNHTQVNVFVNRATVNVFNLYLMYLNRWH